MRRHWNNNGRIIFGAKLFALCSMLCIGMLLCWMLYPERASSGPYLDSAHGSSYGVKRSAIGFPTDYAQGNCVHCHEQHASIGGAEPAPTGGPDKYELLANNFSGKTTNLYAQSDNVCFYCHIVTGTYQSPVFYNYSYSITFGGNPDTTPNNIFDTFNSTSYHNLNDVLNFAKGTSGWPSTFTANSNPCSACHNIHIAKRSCGKPTDSYDPTKSAISRPLAHSSLWGDDTSERLNPNFTTTYQAPYWYGSTTYYEPYSTNTTTDGTNLPDYNTFCTDCHNSTNTIYSTTLGRNLRTIDWVNEKHGKGNADGYVSMNSPYPSGSIATVGNKVLACTDCHEPHGAPNVTLIRKEVNGGTLGGTVSSIAQTDCSFPYDTNKEIAYLCDRCHKDDYEFTTSCYENRYYKIHHDSDSGDPPYSGMCGNCHSGSGSGCTSSRNTQNCNCCHYHGSSVTNATNSPATRRTF